MSCKLNKHIQAYIDLVNSGLFEVCEEQIMLCELVQRVFDTEDIYVNEEQLEQYLTYEKYFPYKLLDWEKFCFALHNCVYRKDGQLRFPILVIYVGRGAGKNGYLSFEDFCLLTPTNGIKNYNIDIFAMSEKQAMQSFKDVYDVLEDNKAKMSKHFRWTKELIVNLKTKSEFAFNTSSPKTKDGYRPGKVDFDEYHAYENMKLVDVATTGLGKKPHPRRTIITTDGNVRGGPLDTLIDKCMMILRNERPDNGTLPYLCRIKDIKEINDKKNWTKANPSLYYFPTLQHEMEIEYDDYLLDPLGNASFPTKRMNCPQGEKETEVTSWANILLTNKPIIDLSGKNCVAGIDYAKTTDFVAAGLLFDEDYRYWITHTWVCSQCADLSRIKAPLKEWEAKGLLTFIDGPEISPDIPAYWLAEMRTKYNILKLGIDSYRHTLLSKSLREIAGFDADKKGQNNIKLVRPSDEMQISPTITSNFNNSRYAWGDNPLMRWYTNNSKQEMSSAGNITYGKIEPKSRKTDGFKALIAAETVSGQLDVMKKVTSNQGNMYGNVWTY